MAEKKQVDDNGGPAFPFAPHPQQELSDGTWDQGYDPGEPGMSLLDWFAGQALMNHSLADNTATLRARADLAYAQAVEMLRVRERIERSFNAHAPQTMSPTGKDVE